MSAFFGLQRQLPAVFEELFVKSREAQQARPKELHAAVTLQKWARGFLTRRRIDKLRAVVVCLQKWWRGYLGRLRAHLAKELRDKRLREDYFAAMATMIQRHWRGFWSRKYVFDFYARKLYLARVAQLNAQMRAELAEEGERAALTQKSLAQAAARSAFDSKVSKLHHLLSTASQPGIFASPYALAAGNVPIIAGAPVEEHLRTAFTKSPHTTSSSSNNSPSSSARPKAPPRAGDSPQPDRGSGRSPQLSPGLTSLSGHTTLPPIRHPGSAGAHIHSSSQGGALPQHDAAAQGQLGATSPHVSGATAAHSGLGSQAGVLLSSSLQQGSRTRYHGPPYEDGVYMPGLQQVVGRHQTLRQVVPYDAVHQAELVEQKVAKAEMLVRHPLPFLSTTRKPDPPAMATQSNRNCQPFQDPWDPTIGARHETFTPNQQRVSPHRFSQYHNRHHFFDTSIHVDAEAFPPKNYQPAPAPGHRAGLTAADMRRIAKQPAAG